MNKFDSLSVCCYHRCGSFGSFKVVDLLTEISYVQPCNPAVGGPAKSQLVHEVDALGGEIGKVADR